MIKHVIKLLIFCIFSISFIKGSNIPVNIVQTGLQSVAGEVGKELIEKGIKTAGQVTIHLPSETSQRALAAVAGLLFFGGGILAIYRSTGEIYKKLKEIQVQLLLSTIGLGSIIGGYAILKAVGPELWERIISK